METNNNKELERIVYVYKCDSCGKFIESPRKLIENCECSGQLKLAKPEEVVKKYKTKRAWCSIMTVLFTLLMPLITICLFMFAANNKPEQITQEKELSFKLPLLTLLLFGAIIVKAKPLMEKIVRETDNSIVRLLFCFLSKNALYIVIVGIIGLTAGYIYDIVKKLGDVIQSLNKITKELLNVSYAMILVIIENTIGYCIFDIERDNADYIIKKAIRQSETIAAIEIANQN